MSRILILETCPSSQSGGAERSTRALCELLKAQGHKLYLGYRDEGDYIEERCGSIYSGLLRVNVPVLTLKNIIKWVSDIYYIACFCHQYKITNIITHVIHIAPMVRILGKLTNSTTGMLLKWRLTTDRAGRKVRWGMAGINHHVAVSEYTLQYWQKNGVSHARSTVVPEGVVMSDSRSSIRPKSVDFHIAFAGRIIPQKGLHILICTCGLLLRQGHSVTLEVAGKFQGRSHPFPDEYHCELEDLVAENDLNGRVSFLGFVDPVEKVFESVDLVVMPSILPEAQPLVVMQAMAIGKVVIATDIGGTGAVLRSQFSQLLFRHDSPEDLCLVIERIMKLSNEERFHLGMELREYVKSNYPADKLLGDTAIRLGITHI